MNARATVYGIIEVGLVKNWRTIVLVIVLLAIGTTAWMEWSANRPRSDCSGLYHIPRPECGPDSA